MPTAKTTTLTFGMEPPLKAALGAGPQREHRTTANLVEVLIRDLCGRRGTAILEQQPLFETGTSKRDHQANTSQMARDD